MKKDPKKKTIWGWIMYDWANSAFATTVMAAVLPVYFASIATNLAPATRTAIWGYTQSAAVLILALLSPILGAISDFSKSRMKFLRFFAFMGMIATTLLVLVSTGDFILCIILFLFGSIGFSGANVFYDALLPEITSKDEIDYISTKGYAMGYLGGGLLLAINLVMIMKPEILGIPDTVWGTRLSFVSVGLWWFIFSIPLFKYVKEDRSNVSTANQNLTHVIKIGFKRISHTFREISRYKELFTFLIAFLLYNEGINTIIKMATIYGAEINIGQTHLIGALLLTQFVGIPFSLLFGKIAKPLGVKNSIYLALSIYTIIVFLGWRMSTPLEFWILATMVGFVQGGAQALTRSLYGSMVPKEKSAEFFGFMSFSGKFMSFLGPLIFGLVGQFTGSSRNGIFTLFIFFILGIIVLTKVDVEKGRAVARGESV